MSIKKYLFANWKMNLGITDSLNLAVKIKKGFNKKWENKLELVLCPSYMALGVVAEAINKTSINLGVQNVFWQDRGSYTGEISSAMIEEVGCEYAIIGHSERREYLRETDEMVNKKIKHCLSRQLAPIVCVGETGPEHRAGKQHQVIIRQIQAAFSGVKVTKTDQVIVAYEPVWVIGTGQALPAAEVEIVNSLIERLLIDLYGREKVANNFRLIYGGSVNSENIHSFLAKKNIHGALVGNASLKSEEFLNIIRASVANNN